MLDYFHAALGAIALLTGLINLLTRKGTRRHRLIGRVYAISMVALIVTSFGIFEFFGGFGAFHVMSLVSGGTLAMALYFPLRRARYDDWIEHHYFWISYSYIGLVMATGSHLFQIGPPGWPIWARALLYWVVPFVVGTATIYARRRPILSNLGAIDNPS